MSRIALIMLKTLIIVIIGSAIILLVFNKQYSAKSIEKNFLKTKEEIYKVTEYLLNSSYNSISICNVDYIYESEHYGEWYVYNTDDSIGSWEEIDNEYIVNLIYKLFKESKYQNIYSNQGLVWFQMWSNIGNNCGGLVYSSTSEIPDKQFVIYTEALSEPNWYYYEEDFNEWKLRNSTQE